MPLISRLKEKHWTGPLSPELSGIFNWISSYDRKEVEKYMSRTEELVPSFKDTFQLSLNHINNVHKWVSEEIEAINGSTPAGCFSKDKKLEQYTLGKFLYPTYFDWCQREKIQGISPKKFTESILEVCKQLGIKAEKKRTQSGFIIKGIGIKEKVNTLDYKLGGEVDLGTSETSRNSQQKTSMDNVYTLAPEKTKDTEFIPLYEVDRNLDENLVDNYVKKISE